MTTLPLVSSESAVSAVPTLSVSPVHRVVVIGGGPAGLMATEVLSSAGPQLSVQVYDAMPSVGRKFLLAGKGGLNLTHSEGPETFGSRYRARQAQVERLLTAFGPGYIQAWAQALGVETFVGSSGLVFPKDLKAAPLLRAWVDILSARGIKTVPLQASNCGFDIAATRAEGSATHPLETRREFLK